MADKESIPVPGQSPYPEKTTAQSQQKPAEAAPDVVEQASEDAPQPMPAAGPEARVPAPGLDTADDSTPFDDEKTERAIADIVARESDQLLQAEDDAIARLAPKKTKQHGSLARFFRNRWTESIILLLLVGGVAAAFATPTSRYWLLNRYGVEAGASVTVTDDLIGQPVRGATVKLGDRTAITDAKGVARFAKLRLGPTHLSISQIGFSTHQEDIVLGWGSNPLDSVKLQATGIQYTFELKDFLSGKAVAGVEVSSGQTVASAGKDGKAVLTLEPGDDPQLAVTVSKDGYRVEHLTLDAKAAATKPTSVSMVPARKAVFVTKATGHYDVYKMDIDGQNKMMVLPGTGTENNNISLTVSPDGTRAALVSTRDDKRDSDGTLLNTLTLINLENDDTLTLAHARQVQVLGWLGTRLVFQPVTGDAAKPYTVVAYDYAANSRVQLASALKLSAAFLAHGAVYFAVAANPADPGMATGLTKINPDGSGKQAVFSREVWSVLRTSYNTLELQTPEGWFSYNILTGSTGSMSGQSAIANRGYLDNAARTQSIWVSSADGQDLLQRYDVQTGRDITVATQAGATYPVRWLNDETVLYRVTTGAETADYVISTSGGKAVKVSDVSDTYGFAGTQ